MTTLQACTEQRLLLPGVAWRTYKRLLRTFVDRPSVRLTFDRGTLELMTPSHEHQSQSYLLGRLVDTLTEELALPVKGGRSTTFKRRKWQRGLEADSCWWIANEPLIRGKSVIDQRRDPPPDLAREIDVTRSSLDRLAIYAKLNFGEVWRLKGQVLTCHLLGSDGRYTVSSVSRAFPGLVVADLVAFLSLGRQMDETTIIQQFRAWVRQRFRTGGSGQSPP
jgi:Uma2 family endonuclease